MKTVLVVDDSRAVRNVSRKYVEPLGFTVLEAEHGEDALAVLEEHADVDLILLDWNMPVMNGITFLKTLRALPRDKQPAVLMCTTENEMSFILQAMEAGANEYIMKPFTEDILKDKFSTIGVL